MKYQINSFDSLSKTLILQDITNSNNQENTIRIGSYVKVDWLDHSCEVTDIKDIKGEINIYIKQDTKLSSSNTNDDILINVEDIIDIDYERTEYKAKEKLKQSDNTTSQSIPELKIPKLDKLGVLGKQLNKNKEREINKLIQEYNDNTDVNKNDNIINMNNDINNDNINSNDSKTITINDRFLLALTRKQPKKNLFVELIESKLQPLKYEKDDTKYQSSLEDIMVLIYQELYSK